MSEKTETQNTEERPETTRTKQQYFFPNGGDVSAFSCKANNLEEAQALNEQHIKETK